MTPEEAEVYEVVVSPLFARKGMAYRVDRALYSPGASVAMVFHDQEDAALYASDPSKWVKPDPATFSVS